MARVDAGSVRLVVNFLGESLPLTSFFFCWNSSIFYLLQLVHHSHGGYNEAMMIGDDRFLIIKKKNAIVTFHLTRQLPTDTFTPTSFSLSDLTFRGSFHLLLHCLQFAQTSSWHSTTSGSRWSRIPLCKLHSQSSEMSPRIPYTGNSPLFSNGTYGAFSKVTCGYLSCHQPPKLGATTEYPQLHRAPFGDQPAVNQLTRIAFRSSVTANTSA